MNNFFVYLLILVAVPCTIFTVRQYRKGTALQRRQILFGGLGAVAVAAIPLVVIFLR